MVSPLQPNENLYWSVRNPIPSRAERRELGKSLRKKVSRNSLGDWCPPADRLDPVEQIIASHAGRIAKLIPVRVARMTASPYGFLRGAANVCAADCASTASTGIMPVICGDAHLGNFGFYGSAEGELVLDMNDFDEAHPGCWEWDMRRLVASVWVAGRENSLSESACADAVFACANAYRDELDWLAEIPLMKRALLRVDLDRLNETVQEPSLRAEVERAAAKARQRTSDRALPKLTEVKDDKLSIIDDPPLLVSCSPRRLDQIAEALDDYLTTLPHQWLRVLGGYSIVDAAHKVVGVGSVGLRSFIALLVGSAPDDVLFLQLKQARRSVIAPYVHGKIPRHKHQGHRVVEYQQALQTVSDPLLGWTTLAGAQAFEPDPDDVVEGSITQPSFSALQVYVRQYRNMKGAVVIDGLDASALADYARVLGMLLAKCHARTSGASLIVGYIGRSDAVAEAFVNFARKYADQTEADYELMCQAVKDARLPSQ